MLFDLWKKKTQIRTYTHIYKKYVLKKYNFEIKHQIYFFKRWKKETSDFVFQHFSSGIINVSCFRLFWSSIVNKNCCFFLCFYLVL